MGYASPYDETYVGRATDSNRRKTAANGTPLYPCRTNRRVEALFLLGASHQTAKKFSHSIPGFAQWNRLCSQLVTLETTIRPSAELDPGHPRFGNRLDFPSHIAWIDHDSPLPTSRDDGHYASPFGAIGWILPETVDRDSARAGFSRPLVTSALAKFGQLG